MFHKKAEDRPLWNAEHDIAFTSMTLVIQEDHVRCDNVEHEAWQFVVVERLAYAWPR